MAVKVQFEIGHAAKLKSKKTPEGFTHDWELFVRGIEKRDISHFVEKVVFNLHDSFPKPKRVIKDAPYVLKESGYAGFNLPIDIYFKNRDEPKRVTYNYDLSLQNTGPPATIIQTKKFVFNNPSDEFRRKLLKGGGIPLVNNSDDKSRDSTDERSQLLSKPKLSTDTSKKHKVRPDETKVQTFATLFGPPITKTSTKVSPDPKNKNSPNVLNSSKNTKISDKSLTQPSSANVKDKPDKRDKKEKHKHSSPHKDKNESSSKDNKKSGSIDDKHERREEKKKDKSHSKDRERSKDKGIKRPASPKRFSSPKRSSPVRSASTTSRIDENENKASTRSTHSDIPSMVNANSSDKISSSSSSSKKAKKEKKSHEKDKERDRKDKDRDKREKDDRSNSSNSTSSMSILNHTTNLNTKVIAAEPKSEYNKKDNNTMLSSKDTKDNKKISDTKTIDSTAITSDKKSSDKHDKDAEKKHKHRKRDKVKEKEKDKEYNVKDKKKEKSLKQKEDLKKISQLQTVSENVPPPKPNPLNTLMNEISDRDSSDSDADSQTTPSVAEKPENIVESSNSSLPDVVVTKPSPSTGDDIKVDKKERKSREKAKVEERKRKRKSKEDDCQTRKSVSPAVTALNEPPTKQIKKDDLVSKGGDKSMSPHILPPSATPTTNTILAPPISKILTPDDTAFRTPSTAASIGSSSNNNMQGANHDRGLTVDYMSELRDLQQKIMTLQDNKELQQVVEMIAATGRFEVTNKTFDFDLCALDRHTVQRLQDFFATSCS